MPFRVRICARVVKELHLKPKQHQHSLGLPFAIAFEREKDFTSCATMQKTQSFTPASLNSKE